MPDPEGTSRGARGLPRFLARLLAILLGLVLAAALALVLVAALFREGVASHVPAGFDVYVSLPSASAFTEEALRLKALDAALSRNEELRGAVRSLRASPFLRSALYKRLAGVRVDAALYPDGSFAAVADLGLRSAATRLSPLFGRYFLGGAVKVKGLTWKGGDPLPRFEYDAGGGLTLYAATRKNLLIVSSTEKGLASALAGGEPEPELESALGARGGGVRFLADPRRFARAASQGQGLGASIAATLDFPERAVADLSLSDEGMSLSIEAKAASSDAALASVMARRSKAPSALSRLPASTEYFSLLAAGRPSELWKALSPLAGKGAAEAEAKADKAARLLFGEGLDGLLYSWIGDEAGVFGSSRGASPVFFLRIGDERARRKAFDALLGSVALGQDLSTLVGEVRVPRIVVPSFLSGILELLGVRLADPYYLIEDGYLYASASAETLAACVAEARSGALLVKTPHWRSLADGVSAQSSLMIYYDLDRSVPFFLRGSGGLVDALRLFKRGAASLSFVEGALRLELSATNEGTAGGAARAVELPGFPVKAGGRMDSDPRAGSSASGDPMAYWTSGGSVLGLDLSSGKRFELPMDEGGRLALVEKGGAIESVWAVSGRGAVYRCDPRLRLAEGFPVLTGDNPTAPPSSLDGSLLVPVGGESAVLIVRPSGERLRSEALASRSLSPAVPAGLGFAVLPRSFDSRLYLMSPEGRILPGWPAALAGIASAPPLFLPAEGASAGGGGRIAAIDEAGELYLLDESGGTIPGFPVTLEGVFDAAPAWAPGLGAIVAASGEGLVWLVSEKGGVIDSARVEGPSGRGLSLRLLDSDGDGREEIFLGGGGNLIGALDDDLSPLPGFPVAGSGAPSFVDVDGDGVMDLVARGSDDTVHAYRLPRGGLR
jgi:hypothetical protein